MDEAFRLLDTALEQRATALVMLVGNDSWEAALRTDPPWPEFSNRLRRAIRK